MKSYNIILAIILIITCIHCREGMLSQVRKQDLQPTQMENLVQGNLTQTQGKREVKTAKEHNKTIKKVKAMENEVDMTANIAESIVKATEEAFQEMGADKQKLSFFEDIIEMVEEVKQAEDNYLELVQQHELENKEYDKQILGEDESEESSEEVDLFEQNELFYENDDIVVIDIFDDQGLSQEIIQINGKNINLDEVIDTDDSQFFLKDNDEDKLRGEELLHQVEDNMIILQEELDELMGVAMEIEDDIEENKNQNQDQNQEIQQVLATLDDFQLFDQSEDETDQDEIMDEQQDDEEQLDLNYLRNQIKDESLIELNKEEQQKQEYNLQQLEKLMQQSQERITADKLYGLLALTAGFTTIYFCFFRNYQSKSDEEEQKINKYKAYSYLDEENQTDQNDDIAQQIQNSQKLNQNEDNGLGMIEEDNDDYDMVTPQKQKNSQQQQEEEEELKTLNNSIIKDENDINSDSKKNQTDEDLV